MKSAIPPSEQRFISEPIRQAMASTGWLLISQVLTLLMSTLATVFVFRYLGPELIGTLNLAMGMVYIAIPLVSFGLRPLIIRELTRQELAPERLLTTALLVQMVAAGVLAMGVLLTAAAMFGWDASSVALLYVLLLLLPLEILAVLSAWFEARVEGRKIALGEIAGTVFVTAGRLVAVWFLAPLWVFATVIVAGALVRGLTWLAMFWREAPTMPWRPLPRARMVALLNDAWPFLLGGLSMMVTLQADIVMLGAMRSVIEVGWYSAAASFYGLFTTAPFMLTRSITPGVIKLREANPSLYAQRLQTFYDFMVWSAIVTAVAIWLLGPLLVDLLLGGKFSEAGKALRVLVWALPFTAQTTMTSPWLLAENHQKRRVWGLVAAAVGNVALNLILIPSYGMYGAAVASVISYGAAGLLPLAIFPKLWPCLRQVLAAWAAPVRWLLRWYGR